MNESPPVEIIIGVDTHQHVHAAVAINALGARVGAMTAPVSAQGYRDLEAWARSLGPIRAFGIEGPGCYGAGLSRALQARGHAVFEVNRSNRQSRHRHGKSDPLHWMPRTPPVLCSVAKPRLCRNRGPARSR